MQSLNSRNCDATVSVAAGSLPASWGSNGSWPLLEAIILDQLDLCGSLPAEWGSSHAFPQVWQLWISNCSITGVLLLLLTLVPTASQRTYILTVCQSLQDPTCCPDQLSAHGVYKCCALQHEVVCMCKAVC